MRWIWQIYLRRNFISKEHLQPYIWVVPSYFFRRPLEVIWYFQRYCFFKTSTCTHPFFHRHWVNSQVQLQSSIRWISIFYYKRVITATHSFKFTVFLQNRNFSNRILTIILILPWFHASIYWKKFIIWRHHLQPSIFFLW